MAITSIRDSIWNRVIPELKAPEWKEWFDTLFPREPAPGSKITLSFIRSVLGEDGRQYHLNTEFSSPGKHPYCWNVGMNTYYSDRCLADLEGMALYEDANSMSVVTTVSFADPIETFDFIYNASSWKMDGGPITVFVDGFPSVGSPTFLDLAHTIPFAPCSSVSIDDFSYLYNVEKLIGELPADMNCTHTAPLYNLNQTDLDFQGGSLWNTEYACMVEGDNLKSDGSYTFKFDLLITSILPSSVGGYTLINTNTKWLNWSMYSESCTLNTSSGVSIPVVSIANGVVTIPESTIPSSDKIWLEITVPAGVASSYLQVPGSKSFSVAQETIPFWMNCKPVYSKPALSSRYSVSYNLVPFGSYVWATTPVPSFEDRGTTLTKVLEWTNPTSSDTTVPSVQVFIDGALTNDYTLTYSGGINASFTISDLKVTGEVLIVADFTAANSHRTSITLGSDLEFIQAPPKVVTENSFTFSVRSRLTDVASIDSQVSGIDIVSSVINNDPNGYNTTQFTVSGVSSLAIGALVNISIVPSTVYRVFRTKYGSIAEGSQLTVWAGEYIQIPLTDTSVTVHYRVVKSARSTRGRYFSITLVNSTGKVKELNKLSIPLPYEGDMPFPLTGSAATPTDTDTLVMQFTEVPIP